ncbi:MAG TPA: hypothetical protein VNI54_01625 [Thermoanaerobaculia bacterium]|nr:hypothetical protein [Thermoanaerobaculia bacterium]
MNVEQILIEVLEPGSMPGFTVQIHVVGSGFVDRAAPFFARFGAQPVQNLFIVPGGAGFSGYLAQPPAPEDRLFVHYADEPEVEPGAEPEPPIVA